MDRNYLKGQDGDRINAVLAAAGFNFRLLLRWLAALLRAIFLAARQSLVSPQPAWIFTSGGTSRTTRWVHRNPPRAAAPDSWRSLRSARVPPVDSRDDPLRRRRHQGLGNIVG